MPSIFLAAGMVLPVPPPPAIPPHPRPQGGLCPSEAALERPLEAGPRLWCWMICNHGQIRPDACYGPVLPEHAHKHSSLTRRNQRVGRRTSRNTEEKKLRLVSETCSGVRISWWHLVKCCSSVFIGCRALLNSRRADASLRGFVSLPPILLTSPPYCCCDCWEFSSFRFLSFL